MITPELLTIPDGIILMLTIIAAGYRWWVAYKYQIAIITRWENVLFAIALTMVMLFYAGVTFDLWTIRASIPLSRLVWVWLLSVSLYISHRMAKRNRK